MPSLTDSLRERTRSSPLVAFGLGCARRYFAIGGTDRAMSVGAHAFSALIPLVLVLRALLGGRRGAEGTGDRFVAHFHLTGAAADAARTLLTNTSGTAGGFATVLGLAVLLLSGVALTRAIQRVYTAAWGLPRTGISGYLDGAAGLSFLLVEAFLLVRVGSLLGRGLEEGLLASLAHVVVGTALWLLLQWLLLSRRVAWRLLLPGAVVSAVGMSAVTWGSRALMPRVLTTNAVRYGPIGVTFGLLTWFLAIAVVVVVGAVVSAEAGGATDLGRP